MVKSLTHQLRGTAAACGFASLAADLDELEELVDQGQESSTISAKYCAMTSIPLARNQRLEVKSEDRESSKVLT
jgi:HPt (histidine-containing phosphotransfer) domain-containing protein